MKKLHLLLALVAFKLPVHAWMVQYPEDTTADRKDWRKPLAPFAVPVGTFNVARGKPVTSSDDAPLIGALAMVTDGEKQCHEGNWVELAPGTQWVQIDLQTQTRIFGVHFWHYYDRVRAYRDVVVQISDDPAFSKGNTSDKENHYLEVEVIGKPVNSVPPKDIAARHQRGELKSVDYSPLSFYWKWPGVPVQMPEGSCKKITAPRPAEFLFPVDATDIRDDASMSLVVPAKRKTFGNWSMQLDFGAQREIYAIAFANAYDSDTMAYNLTLQAADDSAFTKNVRTLFKSKEDKADRQDYKGDPYGGLLIDLCNSEIRGISTRYLRFIRSSYYLKLDACINAAIIGQPKMQILPGQPSLMIWQTKLPFPTFG